MNETSRDWDICRAVDLYRAPRNEGDERTLSDFLAEVGVSLPAQRAPDREQIARIINPDLYVEYDLLVEKGTLADNGKPLAWIVFGTRIERLLAKADAIIALSAVTSTYLCPEDK